MIHLVKKAGQNGIGDQQAVPREGQTVVCQLRQTGLLQGRQQVGHVLPHGMSRKLLIQVQRQAARGAQAQHDGFPQAHVRGEDFGPVIRAAGSQAGGPGIHVCGLCPAPPLQGGGGGRPHAQIVCPFPVAQIVPAFPARAGEVGDFVLVQAILLQQGRALMEHGVLFLVGGQGQTAVGAVVGQRCALFQRQAVGRDMIRRQRADRFQRLPPLCRALAGQGPHEVHAQAGKAGLTGGGHGPEALCRAVRASQQAQKAVIRGLQAQRKAIDARRQIACRRGGI